MVSSLSVNEPLMDLPLWNPTPSTVFLPQSILYLCTYRTYLSFPLSILFWQQRLLMRLPLSAGWWIRMIKQAILILHTAVPWDMLYCTIQDIVQWQSQWMFNLSDDNSHIFNKWVSWNPWQAEKLYAIHSMDSYNLCLVKKSNDHQERYVLDITCAKKNSLV